MLSITLPELRRLLSAVDLKAPLGVRDYLFVVLAYTTGLRVSELHAPDAAKYAGTLARNHCPAWATVPLCLLNDYRNLNCPILLWRRKRLLRTKRAFPVAR